jgi:hypothetical protein
MTYFSAQGVVVPTDSLEIVSDANTAARKQLLKQVTRAHAH